MSPRPTCSDPPCGETRCGNRCCSELSRTEQQRLRDILDRIALVREYRPLLAGEETTASAARDAIFYSFVVIGEAAAALTEELQARESRIPWSGIVGLRNVLAHRYFEADSDLIVEIIRDELEPLDLAVRRLLDDN
ncbi:MAG: DUF86 domain-containing protein [Gaiellaceae bacterium MAG52_C11]|nr:DUF86 domain-containing protein [Candidatus Gaiellasilicea maunaloa]